MSVPFIQSPRTMSGPSTDAQLKKRIEHLKTQMRDIDVNHDDYISREELYQYLDRKVFIYFLRGCRV